MNDKKNTYAMIKCLASSVLYSILREEMRPATKIWRKLSCKLPLCWLQNTELVREFIHHGWFIVNLINTMHVYVWISPVRVPSTGSVKRHITSSLACSNTMQIKLKQSKASRCFKSTKLDVTSKHLLVLLCE